MPSANSHIYQNCYDLAEEMIARAAKTECRLILQPEWDHTVEFPFENLKLEHFGISNYHPHEALKVSVN